MKLYIGCGGWIYWQVDRAYQSANDRLADYATVFNFVEVNNTFYQIPQLDDVKSWRKRVPQNFKFAVKCNRQISHNKPLESIEINFKTMDKMEEICKTLQAVGLVIQTPPGFRPTAENFTRAEEFFSHFDNYSFELIWEPRGAEWTTSSIEEKLSALLYKNGITHCTDISKRMPLYSANISYTRIFGLGKKNQWQFDDKEIRLLHKNALELPKTTYMTFHTQRVVMDAARMKAFDETGQLINMSGKYGVNSMMFAINEYRKYPIMKQELLAAHGWKIIDITKNKQIRAGEIIIKLPNIIFKTKKELKFYIKKLFREDGQRKLDKLLS